MNASCGLSLVLLCAGSLFAAQSTTPPSSPERPSPPIKLIDSGWKASWSPDGNQIVYGKGASAGLEILDLRRLSSRELTDSGKDPVWSPQGAWIAFVREPAYNAYEQEEVWIIRPNGKDARRIVSGGFPGWSGDGRSLYVQSRKESQIQAVLFDQNGPIEQAAPGDPSRKVVESRIFFDKPTSWYPAVSPDGTLVASGAAGRLTIFSVAAGDSVATASVPGERGLLPCWSPDNRYVAFGGFDDSEGGIRVFDVKSKKLAIVMPGRYTMPTWSQDGSKLAFDFREGPREVWIVGQSWVEQCLSGQPQTPPIRPEPAIVKQPEEDEDTTTLRGRPAPNFSLKSLKEESITLADLKGSVVVLDFWASWCPPCRQSLPKLQKVHENSAWRERGLRVFAVNLREPIETVQKFINENKLTFTVPLDKEGKTAQDYRVMAIPTTVVIDRTGVICDVLVGYGVASEKQLEIAINNSLQ